MKNFVPYMALAVALALAGCSSKVALPAVPVEAVEVFLPGSVPDEEYKILERISEEAALSADDQTLVDRAQARAAGLGADALIITAIGSTTEGAVETDLGLQQRKILEALAVYFPSRHPELIGN